jgi:hypothetical protein
MEDQIPVGVREGAKAAAQTGAVVARKGFDSVGRGTQAATLATYSAGVLGAATGALSADTGLLIAASSPILTFARMGVEHLVSMRDNPERMSVRRALSPVRFVKGLMQTPGEPKPR